jgi:hypothetical protein
MSAPATDPVVLVVRSTNDVVRVGAYNWMNSTAQLKSAALKRATNRAVGAWIPRPFAQMAIKNPQGMNKSTLLIKSVRDEGRQGCSHRRRIRA